MNRLKHEVAIMTENLTLVSPALCPYVQRIAIALAEKGVAHNRVTVDLADTPGWFLEISPLGRTPVLKVGDAALFESAAILEYLEETWPNPLHPADPIDRARHRAWIGLGSECLGDIARFYSARDDATLEATAGRLHARFRLLEDQLGDGPWFAGARFSLVDTVCAPVFRYFDTFDHIANFGVFDGLAKVSQWRATLAARPSVRDIVSSDYHTLLAAFLRRRESALSRLIAEGGSKARLST
ncbi:glutathione S-transferase family protein [uncultured Ruegeria sp.]|uniref:glutathione S-transferase family protein n=1 Tax=uncultured Ruegeria sp. TaxID=259304 RepID=UPI002606774B|nr:glutathione S-transferase family protein [uncultured Ruegeria sp.]